MNVLRYLLCPSEVSLGRKYHHQPSPRPPLLHRTTFNPRWQPVFGRRVTATVCLGAKLINVTNTFEFLLKNKKSAWPEKKSQWINKRQAVATLNSPNHSCSKNDYTPLNRS